MIGRGIAIATLAGLAGIALGGCYTYQPAAPGQIAPQQNVRVTVTSAQQAELAEVLPRSSRSFPATYVESANGEFLFSVPFRDATHGMRTTTLRNRVLIPASDVVQIETRRLSTWRTAAVAAAITAGISAAAVVAFSGDANADIEKRGNVDENRIPILRWRLPIGR